MSSDAEIRDQIFAEIATHLRVHGPKDWHLIRDKYPDVIGGPQGSATERKFFRWVKKVQGGAVPSARERAIKDAQSAVAKNLPVAPPPSYLARDGARARKNIDFLAAITEIWGDIEQQRHESLKDEIDQVTGHRKIKNPVFFDSSIKRRLDTMESALRIMQQIWDLDHQRRFYDKVVEIIAQRILPLDPEIAQAIMQDLQALNDAEMMTPHASAEA